MLNEKQTIEYAIIGIRALIDELEKDINKGKQYLQEYENGEKPKTPKTPYEINVIIRKKKAEIEKLVIYKNELKFELTEIEQ